MYSSNTAQTSGDIYPLPEGRLSHAYILSGPAGSGKMALARRLAKAMLCETQGENRPCGTCPHCRKADLGIHPDIITVEKEEDKASILIGQVRGMRSDASVLPNEASMKVYIILDAGRMNPPGQNAMLKILEEPPSYAAFILVAENPGELLDTVRSRCVEILLSLGSGESDGAPIPESAQNFLDVLEKGTKTDFAACCFELEKLSRNDLGDFIAGLRLLAVRRLGEFYRGAYSALTPERLMQIVDISDRMMQYTDFNVGAGHTIGLALAALLGNEELF